MFIRWNVICPAKSSKDLRMIFSKFFLRFSYQALKKNRKTKFIN